MSRLEKIRERLKATTAGPWRACTWDPMERPHVQPVRGEQEKSGCVGHHDLPQTEADANFIAHAPQDIAYLLEIAEAARGLVERQDRGGAEVTLRRGMERLRDALDSDTPIT